MNEEDDVDATRARGAPRWIIAAFGVVSLYLVARRLRLLARVWPAWHAGAPDAYPHEHTILVLSQVSGALLALVLPLPLLLGRAAGWPRGRRWTLWGVWLVLFGTAVALDVYQERLVR